MLEVAADPYRWQRSLELLDGGGHPGGRVPAVSGKDGPGHRPVLLRGGRPAAVHDGSPALARHVANAILKQDSRGARLSKEHKDSKRRIDAAVAAVMAHDRAATLAGVPGHSIYL